MFLLVPTVSCPVTRLHWKRWNSFCLEVAEMYFTRKKLPVVLCLLPLFPIKRSKLFCHFAWNLCFCSAKDSSLSCSLKCFSHLAGVCGADSQRPQVHYIPSFLPLCYLDNDRLLQNDRIVCHAPWHIQTSNHSSIYFYFHLLSISILPVTSTCCFL